MVAIDRKHGRRLMSFQELSTRERGSKDSLVDVDKIKVIRCHYLMFETDHGSDFCLICSSILKKYFYNFV